MKTSDSGLKMITLAEGNVLKIYKDQAGLDTIGVGHLLTADDKSSGRFTNGITAEQSMELLRHDVVAAENAVNSLVKVSLTQNQFDALVDFVFNLGKGALQVSTLLKKLNAGNKDAVPAEFLKWNKVRNPKTKQLEVNKGITRRRQREADLWKKE
jgi:lysozyme